jgi:hypothetical protein
MLRGGSGTVTGTIQIDGVAYTGAATVLGSGASWTAGTSTYVASGNAGSALQISGLALGLHRIKFTATSAANTVNYNGCYIQTPIYASKSNSYDRQNTYNIGSNSLSDSRKVSFIKDSNVITKNSVYATGVVSGPTVTGGTLVPMPDMSATIKTNGNTKIKVSFTGQFFVGTSNFDIFLAIYIDGYPVSPTFDGTEPSAGQAITVGALSLTPVSAGVHKVDVYWGSNATATAVATMRSMIVEEI